MKDHRVWKLLEEANSVHRAADWLFDQHMYHAMTHGYDTEEYHQEMEFEVENLIDKCISVIPYEEINYQDPEDVKAMRAWEDDFFKRAWEMFDEM